VFDRSELQSFDTLKRWFVKKAFGLPNGVSNAFVHASLFDYSEPNFHLFKKLTFWNRLFTTDLPNSSPSVAAFKYDRNLFLSNRGGGWIGPLNTLFLNLGLDLISNYCYTAMLKEKLSSNLAQISWRELNRMSSTSYITSLFPSRVTYIGIDRCRIWKSRVIRISCLIRLQDYTGYLYQQRT